MAHPWGSPAGNGAGGYVAAGASRPYPTRPVEHPRGTTILVLGVLGFFFPFLGPLAWYLGNRARREIRTSGLPYRNEQSVLVGRLLGQIVTILLIIAVAFGAVVLGVAGIMARQFGTR